MKEKQEIKIKNALMDFINKEIQITGEPAPVSNRKYELVEILFGLFLEFDKYLHPPKLDQDKESVL